MNERGYIKEEGRVSRCRRVSIYRLQRFVFLHFGQNAILLEEGRLSSFLLPQFSFLLQKGELLRDWRRLNVALTRAKHKLIMVGCTRNLIEYEPCAKLIKYLQAKQFVLQLKNDCFVNIQ